MAKQAPLVTQYLERISRDAEKNIRSFSSNTSGTDKEYTHFIRIASFTMSASPWTSGGDLKLISATTTAGHGIVSVCI